ncbi:MAG: gliding motility-associated C-terminal domain-containing protein, partial [Flavobacteriales bacterium]|nr:gliding motility-associated C-terminal domain-containing protein [Flavobacteriales bacterium]
LGTNINTGLTLTMFLEDPSEFPELGDECFSPDICLEIGTYMEEIDLPDNPNGYYLVWERCCRSAIISNIELPGDRGIVFVATVPDPALQNSSPFFEPYPADGYFCVGSQNTFAFATTDVDGDSLVYSLDNPIYGDLAVLFDPNPNGGGPMPYNDFPYVPPYSLADPVGGSPVMSINSETGEITAAPDDIGIFAFAVLVEEFRDGVKIGEVRREIALQSTTCELDVPPNYVGFNNFDTVFFNAFEANLLDIIITDNPLDSVWQDIEGEIFDGSYFPIAEFDTTAIGPGIFSGVLRWDSLGCDLVSDEPYTALFLSQSQNACTDSISTDTLNLAIYVQLPDDVPTQLLSPMQIEYTYVVIADTIQCLNITASDGNYQDTLNLFADFSSEIFLLDADATFNDTSGTQLISSPLCWVPDCEHVRPEPYSLDLTLITERCFETDTVDIPLEFYVTTASDGTLQVIPNVFTPNGDEINDRWEIEHIEDKCVTEEDIKIYNRWGNIVLEETSLQLKWDADTDAGDVPEGQYIYTITYKFLEDPRDYQGYITIFR